MESIQKKDLYKEGWGEWRPDQKGSKTKDGVQPYSGTVRARALIARDNEQRALFFAKSTYCKGQR